jgi:hypothetical protein
MRPVHPGEVLREDYLKPLSMSANALAKALSVKRPVAGSGILNDAGMSSPAKQRGFMHYVDPDSCRYYDGPLRRDPPALSLPRQRPWLAAAKLLPFVFVMNGLTACSAWKFDRDSLAAQGVIDESAPVKAMVQIIIQAPPAKIWGLLTNIKDWTKWQPDISEVAIQAAPEATVPFTWSTGGMTIHSTIRLFDPDRRIGWTGRAFHIHAIHVWTLRPLADGRVLVETRESMDGWLVDRFYSSRELLESDKKWLEHLKKAAES